MNPRTIGMIAGKEIRDQLRDRRTLFVMVLAPVLLYPTLAFSVARLAPNLVKNNVPKVGILGTIPSTMPRLTSTETAGFAPEIIQLVPFAAGFRVISEPNEKWDRSAIRAGKVDVLLEWHTPAESSDQGPTVTIHFDGTNEMSTAVHAGVREIVDAWKMLAIRKNLEQLGQSPRLLEPFVIAESGIGDVATSTDRSQSIWSRLFPFAMVMLLLTGAFYPAIDLCAGEKERGTMETLLISPALRTEIVMGKFLTVWGFSFSTTILNLTSLALSVMYVAEYLPGMGGRVQPPTGATLVLMVLVIIPLSAFISAWCMALAVFARSTREGQYYLTPLFLIVTPLVFLTVAPGVTLTFVTSLVPIANVSLLMKGLLGTDASSVLPFVPLVLGPTVLYAVLALVWAVDQFQREEVLFREAERVDPKAWLRWLLRAKEPTPNTAEALFLFVVIVGLCSYAWRGNNLGMGSLAIALVGLIAAPTIIWTLVLTTEPRRTFLWKVPSLRHIVFGIGLALMLHPAVAALAFSFRSMLGTDSSLHGLLVPKVPASVLATVLVAGLLRACCEELFFRGFVLQAMRRRYPPPLAVCIVAMLSGIFPLTTWQAPLGAILGVVLGTLAVRTRSLAPCIVFAAITNILLAPQFYPWLPHWDVGARDLSLATISGVTGLSILAIWVTRPGDRTTSR